MREFVHFRRFAEADSVAMALERAHTEAASILTYNDENSLACADFLSWRAVLCSGDYSCTFLAGCNSTNQNLLLRVNRFLGSRRFPNIPTIEPKMDSIAMPGGILHHRHQAEPVLH